MKKLGFGGSCHWCTEAIFQSLKGVVDVSQGWIASDSTAADFSEAVIVLFDSTIISLDTLIAVHLHSHSCTSSHSMRSKYRSAVYVFDEEQARRSTESLRHLQAEFEDKIITQVLPFKAFKMNKEEYLNYYYYDNMNKPFCKNYISPKLKVLLERFGSQVDEAKFTRTEDDGSA